MKSFECAGAPRDQGLDQGRALRAEIREALGADSWRGRLGALRRDPASARLRRDLRRYFPHQAEWLEGMAQGSGVSVRALVQALARSAGAAARPVPVLGVCAGGIARLARPLDAGAVLRRVAPEGRFASLDLGEATASSPWLGVNEAGLAVAVRGGASQLGRFAPPASLFARDCLERFARVEAALEWCLKRPAAPGAALLFADARGDLAGVETAGARASVLRPRDGWIAAGLPGFAAPPKPAAGDGAALEAALVTALAAAAPGLGALARLDPAGRRLAVGEQVASLG